jgi:hypothetical protein
MVFYGTPSRFARRSSSLVVLVVLLLLLLLLPLEAVDDITPRAVLMSQLTASASSFAPSRACSLSFWDLSCAGGQDNTSER